MRFKRKKKSQSAGWIIAAGVALTGAAAAYAVSRLLKSGPVSRHRELRGLEKDVVRALLKDEVASSQGIDVAAVGTGVVELSGTIETPEDMRHIVTLVDGVPGVHAVVNRMEVRAVEARLQRNQKRQGKDGARWYGGGVGMGRRRQSPATDPAQRDDHVELLMRSQLPNRDDVLSDVEAAEGTGVRIGLSRASALTTNVGPASPDPSEEVPGAPPEVAPHDVAQRQ